jgi:chromosome segregation ATPase
MKNPLDGLSDGLKFLIALALAIVIMLGLLFLVPPADAQEAAASATQINAALGTVDALRAQAKNMNDVVFPGLKSRKIWLDDRMQELRGAVPPLKEKYADLSRRLGENTAAIKQHNSATSCGKKCDDYDADAASLTITQVSLQQELTVLDKSRDSLDAHLDQLSRDMSKWHADAKKARGDFQGMADKAKATFKQLTEAAAVYGTCMDKYPNDDDGGLKKHCGNVDFDHVRDAIGEMKRFKPDL